MEKKLESIIIEELKDYGIGPRVIQEYLPGVMKELAYRIAREAATILDHLDRNNSFITPLHR